MPEGEFQTIDETFQDEQQQDESKSKNIFVCVYIFIYFSSKTKLF